MTLKELRQQSGKTAAEVATELRVTGSAVSQYEKGVRSINLMQVLQLARLYEVSAEEVIQAQIESIKERVR